MNILSIIFAVLIVLIIVITIVAGFSSMYFFRTTILRKPTATLENNINANTNWEKYLPFLKERRIWFESQKKDDLYIQSFDGLKLHGTFLGADNNKKCVICFHGYTSKGTNDFCALSKFYHEQGFNVILADARNHGESEGKYTGFGVLDRKDAAKWIDYAINRFGKDVNIFLHGISMGGATVLMASGLQLPKNVKAIIADCAFTSAYDVFSHILKRDYHIPKFPIMNMTEYMTKKKAGYGYKDVNTLDEVAKTEIPILFVHGENDDFVPLWMTEKNFDACNSEKEILKVKNADHAESYFAQTDDYEKAIKNLIEKYIKQQGQ